MIRFIKISVTAITLSVCFITGAYCRQPEWRVERVDSATFNSAKQAAPEGRERPEAVTDIEKVRKMLDGRVVWGFVSDNGDIAASDSGEVLSCIYFTNGESYCPEPGDEQYFIAYYPSEDILLLEGGHTTDISYNLATGETTENVGNPEYFISSPSGRFRLNGHYSGQDYSHYFVEQWDGDRYRKTVQLDSLFRETTGKWLYDLGEAFWADDDTLYFITSDVDGRYHYRISPNASGPLTASKGYTVLSTTGDSHLAIEIRPDSTFRLDDFLRQSKTVPVTPVKPEVRYRYDEGKGPAYVIERPDSIVVQERKRGGLSYVRGMEELPSEIVFSRDIADDTTVRKIIADGQELEIRNSEFNFDEGALNDAGLSIDYRESEFYYLYDGMNKLLIVSHPMTWTGLMAGFSFYQVMDMRGDKFGDIYEFISFGDSPYLFFRGSDNGYFRRINVEGDYEPASESWDLTIHAHDMDNNGQNPYHLRELPFFVGAEEIIIRGYTGDAPVPVKIRAAEVETGKRLDLAVECPAVGMVEEFLNGPPFDRDSNALTGNRILYSTGTEYYWGFTFLDERIPELVIENLFRTDRATYDRIIAGINGMRRWMATDLIRTWFAENPQIEDIDGVSVPGFTVAFEVVEKEAGYDVKATGVFRYYFAYRNLDDPPEMEREYVEAAFGYEATIKDGREISEMNVREIEANE